jgi:hypothetical protein
LDNLLGISQILLESNAHRNHVGVFGKGLGVPLISFSFFFKGLDGWNFPYSSLHSSNSGALYNNEPIIEIKNALIENNHMETHPYRVIYLILII